MAERALPDRTLAERALAAITARGFHKARVVLSESEHHELAAEFGHLSLLRTNHNTSLSLLGIVDGKQGTVSVNKSTDDALRNAVDDLWSVAQGSRPDTANDISEAQPHAEFSTGAAEPDHSAMLHRMQELLDHSAATYPTLRMGQAMLSFTNRNSRFMNSNGVAFDSRRGSYSASLMFTAKDGLDTSSFNYTGFSLADLGKPLKDCGTSDVLMQQTTEQVRTRKVPGKFVGDLIITPHCLGDFLGFLTANISDLPMVSKTSIYSGKIGEPVAATALNLRSAPEDLIGGYFLTGDGYPAINTPIVEQGLLRSYLLSLYGANKTGLPRAGCSGGCETVDAGSAALDAMIKDVRQGVLLTRFSGGRPNDKGDFSGIAKNSYHIDNGEIQFPLSETMVSGNMAQLLRNIVAISRERADFGYAIYPWVRVSGIGIS